MIYEYIIFNIIVIIIPLFLTIYRFKGIYIPSLKNALLSIFGVACFYWILDIKATGWFWNFNPQYITGLHFFNLPIEEMLFFITIPYSCLFLWVNLRPRLRSTPVSYFPILLSVLLFSALIALDPVPYTTSVLLLYGALILLDLILRTFLFTDSRFIIFSLIILVLTAVFNWYLTSRPIVTYNPTVKTNLQFLTIPVEDFIYGLGLISFVFIIYERITKR